MTPSNTHPEGYFLPIDEAVKLGDPGDAIECCLHRLDGTIEVFADSTTGAVTTPQSDLENFCWSLRGQMETLKYLRKVKEEYLRLKCQPHTQ